MSSWQNAVSHAPTGSEPESSMISRTPYFVASMSISAATSSGSRVR